MTTFCTGQEGGMPPCPLPLDPVMFLQYMGSITLFAALSLVVVTQVGIGGDGSFEDMIAASLDSQFLLASPLVPN